MPQNQGQRDLVAKMKLIPNKAVIEGKKMVFLDDSIVRGTQLKDNTIDLRESGASEVHMRIACPPCYLPVIFLIFQNQDQYWNWQEGKQYISWGETKRI